MLLEPPIDKLIKRAECRYALTCAVSKRARELATSVEETGQTLTEKPITIACREIYDGKRKIVNEQ